MKGRGVGGFHCGVREGLEFGGRKRMRLGRVK